MPTRPQKIAFAELRDMGVRGILVYCADYRCSHSIAISGDSWPDDLRCPIIEARFCLPGVRQARRVNTDRVTRSHCRKPANLPD